MILINDERAQILSYKARPEIETAVLEHTLMKNYREDIQSCSLFYHRSWQLQPRVFDQ